MRKWSIRNFERGGARCDQLQQNYEGKAHEIREGGIRGPGAGRPMERGNCSARLLRRPRASVRNTPCTRPIPNAILVGVTGFEPPTSCSQSKRATGLRYTPNVGFCHSRPRARANQRFISSTADTSGVLGICRKPSNGWSISRIMRTAVDTDSAHDDHHRVDRRVARREQSERREDRREPERQHHEKRPRDRALVALDQQPAPLLDFGGERQRAGMQPALRVRGRRELKEPRRG